MMKPTFTRHTRGMTLVEVMIAVVIIGILTAFALPAYRHYIEKADLNHARTILVNTNQAVAREKLKNNLSATIVQRAFDNVLLAADKSVKNKYQFQIKCGRTAANCEGDHLVNSYYISATPKNDSGYTAAIWGDAAGNVYRCERAADALTLSKDACEVFR